MAANAPETKLRWQLTADEIAALTHSRKPRSYPAGTTLFLEGDRSYFAILIETGRVRVTSEKTAGLGRETVFDFRGSHDIVGELSAIDGQPRSATVTTVDNVKAWDVSPGELDKFLEDHPDAMRRLLVAVIGCLRDADARVESGAHEVPCRIVRRLLELAQPHDEPIDQGTINLLISQKELAGLVGASLRATNKAFQELRQAGAVERGQPGRITILDTEALRRFEARHCPPE